MSSDRMDRKKEKKVKKNDDENVDNECCYVGEWIFGRGCTQQLPPLLSPIFRCRRTEAKRTDSRGLYC